jgi:hypothetical protein
MHGPSSNSQPSQQTANFLLAVNLRFDKEISQDAYRKYTWDAHSITPSTVTM